MQVATSYRGTPGPKFTKFGKCQLARPLTMLSLKICYAPIPQTLPNLVAHSDKMCEMSKSRPKFTKFGEQIVDWPDLNRAKFRHPVTKSFRDIHCRKFVLPKKWTKIKKFIKIGDDLLRTNAPYHAKFHRSRSNDVIKKRYKLFTHFSILAPQGTLCTKVHQSG